MYQVCPKYGDDEVLAAGSTIVSVSLTDAGMNPTLATLHYITLHYCHQKSEDDMLPELKLCVVTRVVNELPPSSLPYAQNTGIGHKPSPQPSASLPAPTLPIFTLSHHISFIGFSSVPPTPTHHLNLHESLELCTSLYRGALQDSSSHYCNSLYVFNISACITCQWLTAT